jgi:hypothetical protein
MASPVARAYTAASGASIYGGRFGLPAWVPAANTLASIPEANTFASINPGNSPANGYSYNYLGQLLGDMSLGWAKVINDYSGGVYNPYFSPSGGGLGCLVFHGGGHSATNWNGIAVFDLNTQLYSIVLGGSLNIAPFDSVNAEYADGSPASPHSYDCLELLGPEAGYAKGALISVIRMAAEMSASVNSTAIHLYDFNAPGLGWVRKVAHTAMPANTSAGGAAAYDRDLNRVWWVSNGNQLGYQPYYDIALNQQKYVTTSYAASPPDSSPDSRVMRYASARKLLLLTSVNAAGTVQRLHYLDTTNPTSGWTIATLSTPLPTVTALGSGMDMAGDGSYYLYQRSDLSNLYRFVIPAVLTDPWAVSQIAFVGSALPAIRVLGKRFSYISALQSFVAKVTAATAPIIYRV